jgi:DNA-binding response OmpR family regulator
MLEIQSKLPARILVIEDDRVLNDQVTSLLKANDYAVDQCFDGEEGLTLTIERNHDLVVLDLMLPGRDGLSLLNIMRKTNQVPVVIVSAKHAEEERIKGLSAGADDYLAKPFNTLELMLRVDAVLRRTQTVGEAESVTNGLDGLVIDRRGQCVTAYGKRVDLTPTQLNLLWTLVRHKDETLSKAFLYKAVLNKGYSEHDRSLDMHLSRVRRKLNESGWAGSRLRTVHGRGYCFK